MKSGRKTQLNKIFTAKSAENAKQRRNISSELNTNADGMKWNADCADDADAR
jgi:hypothetical protein